MYIAFRCYDVDDDQCVDKREVEVVLKNVPLFFEGRYGDSFSLNAEN